MIVHLAQDIPPVCNVYIVSSYMDAELKLYDSMLTGELTPSLEEQLVRIYSPLAWAQSLVHHCCFCVTRVYKDRLVCLQLLLLFTQW